MSTTTKVILFVLIVLIALTAAGIEFAGALSEKFDFWLSNLYNL